MGRLHYGHRVEDYPYVEFAMMFKRQLEVDPKDSGTRLLNLPPIWSMSVKIKTSWLFKVGKMGSLGSGTHMKLPWVGLMTKGGLFGAFHLCMNQTYFPLHGLEIESRLMSNCL